jgi:hypothetical protein
MALNARAMLRAAFLSNVRREAGALAGMVIVERPDRAFTEMPLATSRGREKSCHGTS